MGFSLRPSEQIGVVHSESLGPILNSRKYLERIRQNTSDTRDAPSIWFSLFPRCFPIRILYYIAPCLLCTAVPCNPALFHPIQLQRANTGDVVKRITGRIPCTGFFFSARREKSIPHHSLWKPLSTRGS